MQLGATKFLNKPFNQGQMKEAMEEKIPNEFD
jgi:FixJ family two-component response regulator